jgi:hypothetical protein
VLAYLRGLLGYRELAADEGAEGRDRPVPVLGDLDGAHRVPVSFSLDVVVCLDVRRWIPRSGAPLLVACYPCLVIRVVCVVSSGCRCRVSGCLGVWCLEPWAVRQPSAAAKPVPPGRDHGIDRKTSAIPSISPPSARTARFARRATITRGNARPEGRGQPGSAGGNGSASDGRHARDERRPTRDERSQASRRTVPGCTPRR